MSSYTRLPSPLCSFPVLLLLILLHLQLHLTALADQFTGCGSSAVLDNFPFATPSQPGSNAGTTVASCSRYCALLGFSDTGYLRRPDGTATCYCTFRIPPSSPGQMVNQTTIGGPCPVNSVRMAAINVNFNILGCRVNLTNVPPTQNVLARGNLASFTACFTACNSFTYAYVRPITTPLDQPNMFNCTCSNLDIALAPPQIQVPCGANMWFGYSHPTSTPSGFVKRQERRAALMKRSQEKEQVYCPLGTTACRVATRFRVQGDDSYDQAGPEGNEAYECLDTASELESCGGCLYGDFGGNATTIATAKRGIE
ncbi:hypothetical protein I316_03788 [Kwoniella heveanensis BCC8398]|uniref:Uncharacterized protein n=1 Tax=Kwoniella heveanensis BCC8398 TaxID=1296120 RepID=A0A1B9GUM5_9TREE|nr:hypothetical protein I316_03788 [Kwoniella heveanensis BCC8398]